MFKKKSLGQHFLHSPAYLQAVADAGGVQSGDIVLEIGPGEGALTKVLLDRGAKVVAVEKDARLLPILEEKFAKEIWDKKLELHEADVFDIEPAVLGLERGAYKVVANIPYYITGALFKKFLSGKVQPTTLVFLTQKEVAQRIAKDKKESILSLAVKAYGNPKYIKTVPAGAFSPPPSVDSAILLVADISRNNFKSPEHEKRFFELLRAGFGQKRKLLASNLKDLLGSGYASVLQKAAIDPKARAEDVPLKKWLAFAEH